MKLSIRRRHATASGRVKLVVFNKEFGASAPASRAYALSVSDGSCPRGTVSQVDADARVRVFEDERAVFGRRCDVASVECYGCSVRHAYAASNDQP